MLRSLLFFFFFTTLFDTDKQSSDRFLPIDNVFKRNWESYMGDASYRTNAILEDDLIIIGSNGNGFNDAYILDENSGVYIINRRNGKQVRKIGSKVFGDMDVNGVLVYNDKIFYGNDNEEFICSERNGNIIWRIPVSGDVEHQPVLLNNKGQKIIVYGTEVGEVTALDPQNGKRIWSYFSPDFSGWKPTDNRIVFKIKSYFSWGRTFFTKPTVLDVNKDGVDDIIYSDYTITAINGKNGKEIWRKSTLSNSICVSQLMVHKKASETTLSYVQHDLIGNTYGGVYSLSTMDMSGKILSKKYLCQTNSYPDDILNILKSDQKEQIFTLVDSVFVIDESLGIKGFDYKIKYKDKNINNSDSTIHPRSYPEALLGNKEFSYKNHSRCILILNQSDSKNWNYGFISILSLDTGKIIDTWELPGRSEFPPLIEDINKDGKQDLLINCSDGRLYCYTLTNLIFN